MEQQGPDGGPARTKQRLGTEQPRDARTCIPHATNDSSPPENTDSGKQDSQQKPHRIPAGQQRAILTWENYFSRLVFTIRMTHKCA